MNESTSILLLAGGPFADQAAVRCATPQPAHGPRFPHPRGAQHPSQILSEARWRRRAPKSGLSATGDDELSVGRQRWNFSPGTELVSGGICQLDVVAFVVTLVLLGGARSAGSVDEASI